MKRGTTKKINYKIIKNAGAKIRVVGSWANVRNFAVYLHQKSYNTTRKIQRRKCELDAWGLSLLF